MLPRRGILSRPTDEPPFTPGIYKHYKGGMYHAIGLACHEETHEWYVIYKPMYEHGDSPDTWIRAYANFFSSVSLEGAAVPRFTLIPEAIVDAG